MSSFVQECGASHQDPASVQYARKISRLKASTALIGSVSFRRPLSRNQAHEYKYDEGQVCK
jgi:hypothetical protein